MLVRFLALVALCLAVLPARADEAQIRKVIESKLDGSQIESVHPMPVLGLYEVVIRNQDGPRIVYS
ncbi:MAG: disulfide isomerase DsbC N-terminal domain-containing protein, partial [Burkholderiales bacterium]